MGVGFGIGCRECDYKKDFILGIGFDYNPRSLRDIDSKYAMLQYLIKSNAALSLVKRLIKDKNGKFAGKCGHRIYICSRCGEFHERFSYCIYHDEGYFEPKFICNKCYGILNLLDEDKLKHLCNDKSNDLSEYYCPSCGRHSLIKERTAQYFWD